MKAIAIIQARMSSTRLPGKVLADIQGKPLLERVLERVRAVSAIDRIIVATTTCAEDEILIDWLNERNELSFRGDEHDVLDRYYQCARLYEPEFIVRVTADDPLKDPEIIAHAMALCADSPSIDYVSNTLAPTYPEGLDIEVLRFRALERAHREACLLYTSPSPRD